MEHQGAVRSYAARLAPDAVTADDLAQEVFLTALRSLDRVDEGLSLRAYLLGIARNLARMAWRDRLRGREVSGEAVFDLLAARSEEGEAPDRSERRRRALEDCLKHLPPRAQEVIFRHYRDEERCDEIARGLQTTPGNIRSILTRARRVLRECMEHKLRMAIS